MIPPLRDPLSPKISNQPPRFGKRTLGFSLPLVRGRAVAGVPSLIPRRRPITTVVGRPLEVPRVADPTHEQVLAFGAHECLGCK